MTKKDIIQNPRLQIKVSHKLRWFIVAYLKNETDLPEGIRAILLDITNRWNSETSSQGGTEFENLTPDRVVLTNVLPTDLSTSHDDINCDDATDTSTDKNGYEATKTTHTKSFFLEIRPQDRTVHATNESEKISSSTSSEQINTDKNGYDATKISHTKSFFLEIRPQDRTVHAANESQKISSSTSSEQINTDKNGYDATKISHTKSFFLEIRPQDRTVHAANESQKISSNTSYDEINTSNTKSSLLGSHFQDNIITAETFPNHLTKSETLLEDVPKEDLHPEDFLLYLEDLKWIYNYIQARKPRGIYFHEHFEGCEIILPKNPDVVRSEVLEERCQRLREQFKCKAYDEMTRKVDCTRRFQGETFASQLKEMDKQMVAVAQVVLSVIGGFAFGFMGVELMVGEMKLQARLVLGVACALAIALAEFYFLLKKLNVDERGNRGMELSSKVD